VFEQPVDIVVIQSGLQTKSPRVYSEWFQRFDLPALVQTPTKKFIDSFFERAAGAAHFGFQFFQDVFV
jgi:hypothetical protein